MHLIGFGADTSGFRAKGAGFAFAESSGLPIAKKAEGRKTDDDR